MLKAFSYMPNRYEARKIKSADKSWFTGKINLRMSSYLAVNEQITAISIVDFASSVIKAWPPFDQLVNSFDLLKARTEQQT